MPKRGPVSRAEILRREKHLSVTELAAHAGFSHTYVSLVEGRRLAPSTRYMKAVARVLGVPIDTAFPEEMVKA